MQVLPGPDMEKKKLQHEPWFWSLEEHILTLRQHCQMYDYLILMKTTNTCVLAPFMLLLLLYK